VSVVSVIIFISEVKNSSCYDIDIVHTRTMSTFYININPAFITVLRHRDGKSCGWDAMLGNLARR